jgi:hypothetical protein
MHRTILSLFAALMLAACTNANDLDEAPAYLGNFSLGHNVVVAPNLTKGPASREASEEEWIAAMQGAVAERFSRYEGDKLYHLGISIEGYVLAIPGIPLVAAPKSALILRVTAWDDAAGKKLNEEPEQITVIESISANTMLGSGLTQSKEVQIENLTRNAAKLIQNWLVRENTRNNWFEDENPAAPLAPTDEIPTSDDVALAAPGTSAELPESPVDGPEAEPETAS